MTFPSRGCRTCKQRRIKCDEARPVCNRCQKANLICHGIEEDRNFIFLSENEYAVGRRKRPRGPNVKTTLVTRDNPQIATSGKPKNLSRSLDGALPIEISPAEPQSFFILPALDIPLDDQALTYYSRYYVEVQHGLPEIVDSHLKYALVDWCYSQPQSILSLAIFAVSHATFGRARKNHAALAVGCTKYSKALMKTNLALKDASEATHDEVLLAVMLLSFYENSVMDKTPYVSSRDIQVMASRSFAHHDGAMAVLNLRRQLDQRTNYSMELDKLVRRQLMRSLLLRNMPLPSWLRDGSQYGEHGFALKLDHCMVGAAKLRHQASSLSADSASPLISDRYDKMVRLRRLLVEAQTLDDVLVIWANSLPTEYWYSTRTLQDDGHVETGNRVFDGTVHIYPTVGHAGMWNRYRALRLIVNDLMLKTLSVLAEFPDPDTESLEEAAKLRIQRLAGDLCASVPCMLGLIKTHHVAGHDVTVVTKVPASLKIAVKATTASFLCWPLTIATMVSGMPEQHQLYLRNRLLDVSEIVDDGVLERIAAGFSPISRCSANVP